MLAQVINEPVTMSDSEAGSGVGLAWSLYSNAAKSPTDERKNDPCTVPAPKRC